MRKSKYKEALQQERKKYKVSKGNPVKHVINKNQLAQSIAKRVWELYPIGGAPMPSPNKERMATVIIKKLGDYFIDVVGYEKYKFPRKDILPTINKIASNVLESIVTESFKEAYGVRPTNEKQTILCDLVQKDVKNWEREKKKYKSESTGKPRGRPKKVKVEETQALS